MAVSKHPYKWSYIFIKFKVSKFHFVSVLLIKINFNCTIVKIYHFFIRDEKYASEEIKPMPGIYRQWLNQVESMLDSVVESGFKS